MKRWLKWLVALIFATEFVLLRVGLIQGRLALAVVALVEGSGTIWGWWRIALAVRRYRRDRAVGLHVWAALDDGLASVFPRRVARLLTLEMRLWASLLAWVARRHHRFGTDAFGYARQSSLGVFLLVIVFTAPVEPLIPELLIPWTWARLALLVLDIYTALWLVGLYASLVALPHRLDADGVTARYGVLAEATIAYTAIESVASEKRPAPKGRDGLRLLPAENAAYFSVGGATNVTLRLRSPQSVRRAFGNPISVTTLHIAADEPARFVGALRGRLPAVSEPAAHSPALTSRAGGTDW